MWNGRSRQVHKRLAKEKGGDITIGWKESALTKRTRGKEAGDIAGHADFSKAAPLARFYSPQTPARYVYNRCKRLSGGPLTLTADEGLESKVGPGGAVHPDRNEPDSVWGGSRRKGMLLFTETGARMDIWCTVERTALPWYKIRCQISYDPM